MHKLALLLLAIAVAMAAFSAWGLLTRAGNAAFDEMAGMIPFAAGVAAVPLAAAAAVLRLLAGRR